MEPFQLVHRFNTLARREFITPLACSMCRGELIIRLGKDDEPYTKCYTCGAVANLSVATILTMERTIANYERGRRV